MSAPRSINWTLSSEQGGRLVRRIIILTKLYNRVLTLSVTRVSRLNLFPFPKGPKRFPREVVRLSR